jgi:hypothetical protein
VQRKQNARGQCEGPQGLARNFAKCFDFQIAPDTSGFAGTAEPQQFRVDASAKITACDFAAARGDECDTLGARFFQPAKRERALGIAAEPIEAELDGFGSAPGKAHLTLHLRKSAGSNHGAEASQTGAEGTDSFLHVVQFIENKGSSITFFVPIRPYQKCKAGLAILLTRDARLVTFARDKSPHGPKGVFSKELRDAR